MPNPQRPRLSLKPREVVPAEEDRLVEVGVHDALLPCRKFEVTYKVATLGKVSPSLEFLLRLVKAVPGIDEDRAASFFGFSADEMAYVLREANGPGYLDPKDGRLWLSLAGELLFGDQKEPFIFKVERRQKAHGFDLLSVAPEPPIRLSPTQLALPELPLEDAVSTGNVAERLPGQFRRFFRELADRADRDQPERRDLYSIDVVAPRDRFQTPVRIKTFVHASSPYLVELVNLNSWRPEHELVDRAAVDHAASTLIDNVRSTANQLQAGAAYDLLIELAPEFLKEFTLRDGLSVGRYWRSALSRAGEPRRDRKTIPIAGSLVANGNIERISNVLGYGFQAGVKAPAHVLAIASQVQLWGATTLYGELLTLIKAKASSSSAAPAGDVQTICLAAGKPERYIERTFELCCSSERPMFPAALELLLVPGVMVVAMVHAPIGAVSGFPVALGLASFDEAVVARAQKMVLDSLPVFNLNDNIAVTLSEALAAQAETSSE